MHKSSPIPTSFSHAALRCSILEKENALWKFLKKTWKTHHNYVGKCSCSVGLYPKVAGQASLRKTPTGGWLGSGDWILGSDSQAMCVVTREKIRRHSPEGSWVRGHVGFAPLGEKGDHRTRDPSRRVASPRSHPTLPIEGRGLLEAHGGGPKNRGSRLTQDPWTHGRSAWEHSTHSCQDRRFVQTMKD